MPTQEALPRAHLNRLMSLTAFHYVNSQITELERYHDENNGEWDENMWINFVEWNSGALNA
jgi:hypothetical protein